jgi:hypothetical protein
MSDSRPTSNSKNQMSPTLTYKYAVWNAIERADEYPADTDGSQTISELCREYTHIVDDLKWWPYFDIPGCLKRLPWSVDECYRRISPQWIQNSSLTRHAVVQLALYTCPPFRDMPPDIQYMTCVSRDGTPSRPPGGPYFDRALPDGYYFRAEPVGQLIDQSPDKSNNQKQRKYPCPAVVPLIEALATALIDYEHWCEQANSWPHFQMRRDACITFLKDFLWLRKNASQRGFTPQDPKLWHNRSLPNNIQRVTDAVDAFNYNDYQHTNAPTNEPRDPGTRGRKYDLLNNMNKAFSTYKPEKWSNEATYRALAAIVNQMEISYSKDKQWTPAAIKQLLKRDPNRRLTFTVHLTRPNVVPWYTRPE